MIRHAVAALAMILSIGGAGAAQKTAGASCRVDGKLVNGPSLSRAAICRAVIEGLDDEARHARVDIVVSFEAPATVVARLVDDGTPHTPVSIAISDRAMGRGDLIGLGRTIAGLLRAY